MIEAWILIGLPLVLYIITFIVELITSVTRLFNHRSIGNYLDATWEITFTFLILAVVNMANLFSSNIEQLADAFFTGIFIVGGAIVVRAILYLVLFYIRTDQTKRTWLDWIFALSHLGIITGLAIVLTEFIPMLNTETLIPNTQFLPYMWGGLIVVVLLCSIPLSRLYFASSAKSYER